MIKVFCDTNVLIAAAFAPQAVTARSLLAALHEPYALILSEYVVDEYLEKITHPRFHEVESAMRDFLYDILPLATVVKTPEETVPEEDCIADIKDKPILRAAVSESADIFVSGDKHFLNARSSINSVKILNFQEFFALISEQ